MVITYEDFSKIDLRSGTIVKVEIFDPSTNSAYKIWADFGYEVGVIQTAAKITENYTLESLIGKRIVGCVNLKEKNIFGFISQFLLIGFSDKAGAISLVTIDGKILDGECVTSPAI
jgi:tRNA-binding protein